MNYQLIIPEIFLAVSASLLLGFGVSRKKNHAPLVRNIAIGVLVIYALMGLALRLPVGEAFNGAFVVDAFAYYVKLMIGLAAAVSLLLAGKYLSDEKLDHYEFSVLMLYSVLGMSLMISANNLLTLYVGIEMQSLALYIMAAFNRDSLRATEAGLKYFVLGALSSGLLLYGMSLIYGFTGSLGFDQIAASVAHAAPLGVIGGMVFMLSGLAFKISAAPFHMWTPDVYEGSPTPVTAFFAGAPKFAAMAVIARLTTQPFSDIFEQTQQIIIILAILSMVVGALGALNQSNIKRMMAYSSIANMGYALVPLAAGTAAGVQGMLIFMTIYLITVIGAFACILQMRIRDGMVEKISDLAGLAKTRRSMAALLTAFMFSLMGMPPFIGFFGKLFAFLPAVQVGLIVIVVIALLTSVIAAFYYLRIIKTMWLDEPEQDFVGAPLQLRLTASVAGVMTLGLVLLPFAALPMLNWAERAAASLF